LVNAEPSVEAIDHQTKPNLETICHSRYKILQHLLLFKHLQETSKKIQSGPKSLSAT